MKVKELVEKLLKLNQDKEIYFKGYDCIECAHPCNIDEIESIHDYNKNEEYGEYIDLEEHDGVEEDEYIIY